MRNGGKYSEDIPKYPPDWSCVQSHTMDVRFPSSTLFHPQEIGTDAKWDIPIWVWTAAKRRGCSPRVPNTFRHKESCRLWGAGPSLLATVPSMLRINRRHFTLCWFTSFKTPVNKSGCCCKKSIKMCITVGRRGALNPRGETEQKIWEKTTNWRSEGFIQINSSKKMVRGNYLVLSWTILRIYPAGRETEMDLLGGVNESKKRNLLLESHIQPLFWRLLGMLTLLGFQTGNLSLKKNMNMWKQFVSLDNFRNQICLKNNNPVYVRPNLVLYNCFTGRN